MFPFVGVMIMFHYKLACFIGIHFGDKYKDFLGKLQRIDEKIYIILINMRWEATFVKGQREMNMDGADKTDKQVTLKKEEITESFCLTVVRTG